MKIYFSAIIAFFIIIFGFITYISSCDTNSCDIPPSEYIDSLIIKCSKTCNKELKGTYIVSSTIDSLDGDEVEIKKDSSLYMYDYAGNGEWAVWNLGKVNIVSRGTMDSVSSSLYYLNGRIYICDKVVLLDSLKIRLYKR